MPAAAACKKATQGCLCGYHGSSIKQCKCSPQQIEHYVGKISGPLIDRIAVHISVKPVDVDAWKSRERGMTTATMHERVARALDVQSHRFEPIEHVDCNARIPDGMFASLCAMDAAAETMFVRAQKSLLVSARARGHIVRVARTIADLDGNERISERHIAEAVGYRGRDSR